MLHSFFRSLRGLTSRINGISTPLIGLSWVKNPPEKPETQTPGHSNVLTPAECAQILRLDEPTVIALLKSGELLGLSIEGKWRITIQQLAAFLGEKSREIALEILYRKITDPKIWAMELRKQPEIRIEIEGQVYSEGSFGQWLQDALRLSDKDNIKENEA